MKTVLVTGASGFVGKNLCSALRQRDDIVVLPYDLNERLGTLETYVSQADFVVHLAGVNRPENESEYDRGNRGFTDELLGLLEGSRKDATLVFASSIQAETDSPYGLSKRAAEDLIEAWSEHTGNASLIYRFPNLFGKWCKPNYNSVVATFCHNIAHDLPVRVDDPKTVLRLAYIDDVVAEIVGAIDGLAHIGNDGFGYLPRTFAVKLGDLADKIRSYAACRRNLVMPDFTDDFDRFLYGTYTSYLPHPHYSLDMKRDERGWFAEFIKSNTFGQISISRTKPGVTRGNHWHHTKAEKFLVVEGDAIIKIRRADSEEVFEIFVSGCNLTPVDIPLGSTHSITNVGKTDVITLFWASELFDPLRPDTYYLEV